MLRKFIQYYKDNIDKMILKSKNVVYIFTVNKDKNIFKIGRTTDLRKRLFNYMTGKENHPDIAFIMQVSDPIAIENCVKGLIRKSLYKKDKELYKISIGGLKQVVIDCAISLNRFEEINSRDYNAYILFDGPIKKNNVNTK